MQNKFYLSLLLPKEGKTADMVQLLYVVIVKY